MAEDFTLSMVEGGGVLQLRDAEPYELETPTAVTGSYDPGSGVITGGTLSTPQVNIVQEVTYPIIATAFIDADFSLVTPGSLTGTVDHLGNVTVQASLAVDLHVDVQQAGGGSTILLADCTTSPVNLVFDTVTPYADGRVTVADANFSIPETTDEAACEPNIAGAIDDQLAGAGHSLTLTLAGDLTLPEPPGCDTTTALVAAPVGTAALGDSVDLTATVTPDPSDPLCVEADTNGLTPGGFVEFLDGTTSLGSALVQSDGTAGLTTAAIQAGSRTLTATYRGASPFSASPPSDPLPYQVTADPNLSATLPDHLTIGAAPTEFDVTARNTGFGTNITHARLDVTISRNVSSADLSSARVKLEHLDPTDTWVTVPLASGSVPGTSRPALWGAVGDATGFPLPVGEVATQRLRIQILTTGGTVSTTLCGSANETCPGPIEVAFDLIAVDAAGLPAPAIAPAPGATATAKGQVMIVEATRRASTVTFAFGGGVRPHAVRQGSTMSLQNVSVGPSLSSGRPTGHVALKLDDVPVAAYRLDGLPLARVPLTSANNNNFSFLAFDLPPNIAVGAHKVTVSYLGDARFLPSQLTTTFNVHEAPVAVTLYDCIAPGFAGETRRYRALVDGYANVPVVRPLGSEVDLSGLQVRMRFSRALQSSHLRQGFFGTDADETSTIGAEGELLQSIDFGFGPGGSGTAGGLTRSNGTQLPTSPNPVLAADVALGHLDESIVFNAPTGSVVIEGEPGTVVPVTLDTIKVTAEQAVGIFTVTCTPVGDPLLLAEITASGHTLVVEPGDVARADEEVTLTSTVAPYTTGQVEFRDGDETVGVANVVNGIARVTAALPIGTRALTAIYTGGVLAPPLVSNAVEVTVLPPLACKAFAVDGNGAVVRLVYIELLGRCPDQAGYSYWKSRLDAGTSPETFARAIARTPEAVGRVVDDAYLTMLGRPADAAGRAFWVGRLLSHGRYDQLLADLAASGEFWSKAGGTNVGFVTRVYEQLLGRAPDTAGLDYWTAKLATGASRRALVLTLANLNEPLSRLVAGAYDEILSRTPDADERTAGIAHLRSTGDRSGLYAELIGLEEFSTRAQEFPNPED